MNLLYCLCIAPILLTLRCTDPVESPLAVGMVAPSFSQNDPSGQPVKLSDFRGKYVLVDFWASWCGPCRAQNPYLVAAYRKYQHRNFTIVSVALEKETNRAAWLKAIETDSLSWPQVSDLKGRQNEVSLLYGIDLIPQNVLVGPDGRIVAKNLSGNELEQKLATLRPAISSAKL